MSSSSSDPGDKRGGKHRHRGQSEDIPEPQDHHAAKSWRVKAAQSAPRSMDAVGRSKELDLSHPKLKKFMQKRSRSAFDRVRYAEKFCRDQPDLQEAFFSMFHEEIVNVICSTLSQLESKQSQESGGDHAAQPGSTSLMGYFKGKWSVADDGSFTLYLLQRLLTQERERIRTGWQSELLKNIVRCLASLGSQDFVYTTSAMRLTVQLIDIHFNKNDAPNSSELRQWSELLSSFILKSYRPQPGQSNPVPTSLGIFLDNITAEKSAYWPKFIYECLYPALYTHEYPSHAIGALASWLLGRINAGALQYLATVPFVLKAIKLFEDIFLLGSGAELHKVRRQCIRELRGWFTHSGPVVAPGAVQNMYARAMLRVISIAEQALLKLEEEDIVQELWDFLSAVATSPRPGTMAPDIWQKLCTAALSAMDGKSILLDVSVSRLLHIWLACPAHMGPKLHPRWTLLYEKWSTIMNDDLCIDAVCEVMLPLAAHFGATIATVEKKVQKNESKVQYDGTEPRPTSHVRCLTAPPTFFQGSSCVQSGSNVGSREANDSVEDQASPQSLHNSNANAKLTNMNALQKMSRRDLRACTAPASYYDESRRIVLSILSTNVDIADLSRMFHRVLKLLRLAMGKANSRSLSAAIRAVVVAWLTGDSNVSIISSKRNIEAPLRSVEALACTAGILLWDLATTYEPVPTDAIIGICYILSVDVSQVHLRRKERSKNAFSALYRLVSSMLLREDVSLHIHESICAHAARMLSSGQPEAMNLVAPLL